MQTKVSTLFFKTNLANFATLLDRIDDSHYYLIPRDDNLQDISQAYFVKDCPMTFFSKDRMKKLQYPQFRKLNKQGYYYQKKEKKNYDYPPKCCDHPSKTYFYYGENILARKIYWFKELWKAHKEKLVLLLKKAFETCHYDDVFNFYVAFIDFIYHHDLKSEEPQERMTIFFNYPEVIKQYPIYISLNLPSIEKFFRVIPTRFMATSCIPTKMLDNYFPTITNFLHHDFFGHKQLIKSRFYTVFPQIESYARRLCDFVVHNHPELISEIFYNAHEGRNFIGTKSFANQLKENPIFQANNLVQFISKQKIQQQDIDLEEDEF